MSCCFAALAACAVLFPTVCTSATPHTQLHGDSNSHTHAKDKGRRAGGATAATASSSALALDGVDVTGVDGVDGVDGVGDRGATGVDGVEGPLPMNYTGPGRGAWKHATTAQLAAMNVSAAQLQASATLTFVPCLL